MKRLRKLLKWTAIVLLSVVSIVILVVAVLNWRASRQVEARLAPLREAGKPVGIADLKPPPVDDSQNAAIMIESLSDEITDYERQLAKATRDATTDEQFNIGAVQVARMNASERPELVGKLREALQLPAFHPDYDYASGPTPLMENVSEQAGQIKMVARILYAHGLMSLADGETDEAVVDAIAVLHWSERVADQPLLVNYLMSAALYFQAADLAAKCLYANDASPPLRTQLLDAFGEVDLAEQFTHAIDTERAFGLSSFESFALAPFQIMLGELSAYLDTMSAVESYAKAPVGVAPENPQADGVFSTLVASGIAIGLKTLRRSQAKARAIQILAAWQDSRLGVDTSIEDLELSETVTTDPFDGSTMKLKVIGDTIAVYSVGKNLVDDGGQFDEEQDVGVSP
ncbi:hypothetical protein Q31b_02720 [Novipirellula aureliae]|uniref:Uncharacterized protein n=1 Tax=Novipirellula aureliae TaxID=2527966 RepID=A0A5C6EBF5_9BACT|nr:hypothetical protein [Novipirellula aureliae]TWU45101.1 hypothetical protein Q31b_02720 [Novipirellula aureliae]